MVYQYQNDIVIVDTGLMFPEEEMLGIDLVIPDMSYLEENRKKIKAIVLTHGHEDHIGAVTYLLKRINVPVYGTRLTLGFLEHKLNEHKILKSATLIPITPEDNLKLGKFTLEFFRVSHSTYDCVGIILRTPVGIIIHTGDFKIDQTPIDGQLIDFHRLAALGQEGVLALLADSTNVEKEGYSISEREVGDALDEIFRSAKKKLIVAAFSSSIPRIQQVINVAHKYNRKLLINGLSMERNSQIAHKLGYLNIPKGILISLDQYRHSQPKKVVVLTTGSQGEPMSSLSRIAVGTHKQISIDPGDTVIISAKMIPGNERPINRTINHLFKLGAEVFFEKVSEIHVSGHASKEDLKLVLNLIKPKYFIPIHGEYRHLIRHGQLAEAVGIARKNIFIMENGDRLDLTASGKCKLKRGAVSAGKVFVDGKGVGDIEDVVLRDRQHLSQDGMVIVVMVIKKQTGKLVQQPDIITRGFIHVKESDSMITQIIQVANGVIESSTTIESGDWTITKTNVRNAIRKFIFKKTNRRPVILPFIIEI